jgi:cytochrome c oxidase subunit IV
MAGFDTKQIWKVFFILLGITLVEFLIALTPAFESLRNDHKLAINITYVVLTLFKAFYIIAYFMHLKFERINMIYSIALPPIFVIYCIVLVLYEGGYWNSIRKNNVVGSAKTEQVEGQTTPEHH